MEIDPKAIPDLLDEMQDYTTDEQLTKLLAAAAARIRELEAKLNCCDDHA